MCKRVRKNRLTNPFTRPYAAIGSHLAILIQVMQYVDGPIVELGTGLYSTPFLHWACVPTRRELFSYESAESFMLFAESFQNDHHHVVHVDDWDDVDLSPRWGLAFVDHAPASRRVIDIRRLRHAEFIVVHDTTTPNRRHNRIYNYRSIRRLFRYRFERVDDTIGTTVFSNTYDVRTMFQ